jgi:hypothetical protein
VLRLDHDPVTKAPKGALIESAATNLLLRSEEFDNAAWVKVRAAATPNTIVAPDGSMTMDKLVEDATATNTHLVQQTVTFAVATHTFSVFAKAAERNWIRLGFPGGSAYFNVGTGATGAISGGATASTLDCGNGVYRCSLTAPATGGSGAAQVILATGDGGITYTGNGTSGVYVWGGQIEAAGVPTSYVKTATTAAPRAADVVSVANGGLWGEAVTVLMECSYPALPKLNWPGLFRFFDSANPSSRFGCWFDHATGRLNLLVRNLGVGGGAITYPTPVAAGQAIKVASRFAKDNFGLAVNGGAPLSYLVGEVPSTDTLHLALYDAGPPAIHVKKLVVVPAALSSVEVQRMTSAPSIFSDPLTVGNLIMVAKKSTTIGALNNNHWLVRLNDGTERSYNYVSGPLSIPASDLGYRKVESYRATLAKPLPATANITFRPPLREAVPSGTNLEFDQPVCRMRLASDSEMNIAFNHIVMGQPTVNFIEDL